MNADSGPPLVSVIVPAFNAEVTLREAVQSVLAGIYQNIEVLIVDDGSTDRTAEEAAEISRADRRVQLLQRRNGGVSAAFNTGLTHSRGKYLARLDSDDLWHPGKLERQVEVAIRHPDAAFIYTFVRYIDGDGAVVRDVEEQRFPPWALCRGLYESLVGGNSSALMDRSAVAAAGGYDESLPSWEDLLLQLRISAAHSIRFVPQYLVGYRIRPNSLSSDPVNMSRSWLLVKSRIERLFPQIPRYVLDWAHGKRCAIFAEGFAWRGQFGASAAFLAQAMRHDPSWTSLFLRYRLARRLKRRRASVEGHPVKRAFLDCRPSERLPVDAYNPLLQGPGLRRLEMQRAQDLAALDEELARTNTPGPGPSSPVQPRAVA